MKRFSAFIFAVFTVVLCIGSVNAAKAKSVFTVLGDSIASGYGIENTAYRYSDIIAEHYGYEMFNYAKAGSTTADLYTFLRSNGEAADAVKKSDIISISIGGNDFLNLVRNISELIPLMDKLSKNDYSPIEPALKEASENIWKIVLEIKNINPDATVILQTIYNPKPIFGATGSTVIDTVNKRLFTDCLAEHPESFLISDVCLAMGKDGIYMADDMIHPNIAGHKVIADTIGNTIDKRFTLEGNAESIVPSSVPSEAVSSNTVLSSEKSDSTTDSSVYSIVSTDETESESTETYKPAQKSKYLILIISVTVVSAGAVLTALILINRRKY